MMNDRGGTRSSASAEPVLRANERVDGPRRFEVTGMWADRFQRYVRERVAPGRDVHVERRRGRTYVVVE